MNGRAADRIRDGHLWIYRSDVVDTGEAQGGEVVSLSTHRGPPLGTAHYSSSSQIALRLLPERTRATDTQFFRHWIGRAQSLRSQVAPQATAYRLVHAEGDLLPALVVDRYGDYFAVQTLSQGMEASKTAVVEALTDLFSPRGIVERNDVKVRAKETLPETSGVLSGEVPEQIEVQMNGLGFLVDLLRGQKTGLFLDQRENYLAAQSYARGTALDCFTYHGAFAMHLARGCERVEAVDSSEPALVQARRNAGRNAGRNALENIEFRQANIFDLLPELWAAKRRYQTIVLDPPAFAKSRGHVDAAARAYKDVNLKALRLLEPGGVLLTCSCSFHFSEADLLQVVAAASLDAGCRLRVIERRTQARDHPILLTVPETHYLKCLIVQVI
ncbi:MAG: class I SAM-dependent rRNA methyltransferase [Bryobacterales bacterium]